MPVNLALEIDERLPRSIETTCYFVVAEALANVAKHAVQITSPYMSRAPMVGYASLSRTMDGVALTRLVQASAAWLTGSPQSVVGSTSSSVPGDGTRVSAEMPCA